MTVTDDRPAALARDPEEPRPTTPAAPGPRRRRGWTTALIAVLAVAVLLAVSPALVSFIEGTARPSGTSSAAGIGVGMEGSGGVATEDGAPADEGEAIAREVAVTADLRLEVGSPSDAAERIGEIARAHDGYVERLSVSGSDAPADAAIEPAWTSDSATLRVPSDRLDAALADLSDLGDVLGTSITREDVTAAAVDLRARISSAEASIARLQELMAQAGSVGDLLEVEAQLAQRQSELEAYQSELEYVEGRVEMSTVNVALVRENAPNPVEPTSPFLDGLLGGWNALVASFGALITLAGFALPWLIPVALVWLIVRLLRRRRRPTAAPSPAEAPAQAERV